jgi:diguanylate cyclase (GGDEF)-like protein/PAS domain S-box-containing protein
MSETESARIAALESLGILDTDPDPAFDRLTKLAMEVFSAPIAFVSFIDQSRQWFKSKQGSSLTQTTREMAFCAHTIMGDGVMVVLNAAEDERFRANPLVCGQPAIRFYAGAPITTADGHRVGTLCIIFTAKEQGMLQILADLAVQALTTHKANNELRSTVSDARSRYALVARATLDGVWDWDIANGTVYYSPRWQYILGLREEDLSATLAHWMDRVHAEDRPTVEKDLEAHLNGETSRFRSEHRMRYGDGSWRWVVVRGLAQRSKGARPSRMAGSLMDVTKDKTSDPLTGLPNRLLLQEKLERLIHRSQIETRWNFAVLFVDVDHYKQINDRFGHVVGDATLRTIAERLQAALTGTRGNMESMVARFAGDEFVVLVDGIESPSEAEAIAKRLSLALQQPILCGTDELSVTVSIGIALAKPELTTPESFLQHSDLAMYRAKSNGRGSFVIFDPSMQVEALARLELEADLKNALIRQELRVYYQPQMNLQTGELVGCEALVRWQHPSRGLIAPGEFIGVAEEIGIVAPIDLWMMETACRQLKEWRSLDPASDLSVSVNISAQHLSQKGLKEAVEGVLTRYQLPPSALCLELTETVLMENIEAGIDLMQELRSIGVGLHMDDFGSGYSSFRQLSQLPFDTLKIDRSFIEKMAIDPQAQNIVEAILSMAHTMGLKVVGEGIENRHQADILAAMDCEIGQGYYFARPLDASSFHELYVTPKREVMSDDGLMVERGI